MYDAAYPPKTTDPLGTLDELQALGVSSARYGSCSVPGPDNVGCPYLGPKAKRPCEFPYAGKHSSEGGGPHHHGVYIRDSSTGSSNVQCMACFHYMANVWNHRSYDPPNVYEVMYNEGEEFQTKGTVEKVVKKGDGKTLIIVEPLLITGLVPKYPRPAENPLLREEAESGRLAAAFIQKNHLRRMASVMPGLAPIDPQMSESPLDNELAHAVEAQRAKKAGK